MLALRLEPSSTPPGGPFASVDGVPRHWIWIQVVILVFLIASVVIAITRLA
jgi:hypothetical protein